MRTARRSPHIVRRFCSSAELCEDAFSWNVADEHGIGYESAGERTPNEARVQTNARRERGRRLAAPPMRASGRSGLPGVGTWWSLQQLWERRRANCRLAKRSIR